jgi:phosphatidylinositol alpha-1,6-mannosyltransferase
MAGSGARNPGGLTLRALVLTPDFPPQTGGIQRLLERFAHHARTIEIEVLTIPTDGGPAWDAEQRFAVRRSGGAPARQLALLRLNAAAIARARQFRPDVVLSGHVVVAPAAIAIKRLLGIPYVQYFYALEVRERAGLAGAAAKEAAAVIAISRYTAELARELGTPDAKIHIVPPGVDLVPSPAREEGGPPRVLTVARVNERYKGHDVMVRALPLVRARVPDAEWVVVGEGPLTADIVRSATATGVGDAIRLVGRVSDADRDAWYGRSHVFAMPSRLPPGSAGEGFGIVYLEAGIRHLPSVAGNVGGALDAVRDGETGLLVDPTSHIEVADALTALLLDASRRVRMGEAAARFATGFEWQGIAERIALVLRATAERSR